MTVNRTIAVGERYGSGAYLEVNPTWHEEDAPWKASQVVRGLEQAQIAPKSIVDIGCGAGAALSMVADRMAVATAQGFDVSPDAIARARKSFPDRTFAVGGVADISERYDVAICLDVFEHVPDYLGFLQEVRRCADFHVFHIPLDLSVLSVLRSTPLKRVRELVGHLHYFTRETALETLREAGYTPIHEHLTAHALELPGRGPKAAISNPLRRVIGMISDRWAARLLGGYSLLVVCGR